MKLYSVKLKLLLLLLLLLLVLLSMLLALLLLLLLSFLLLLLLPLFSFLGCCCCYCCSCCSDVVVLQLLMLSWLLLLLLLWLLLLLSVVVAVGGVVVAVVVVSAVVVVVVVFQVVVASAAAAAAANGVVALPLRLLLLLLLGLLVLLLLLILLLLLVLLLLLLSASASWGHLRHLGANSTSCGHLGGHTTHEVAIQRCCTELLPYNTTLYCPTVLQHPTATVKTLPWSCNSRAVTVLQCLCALSDCNNRASSRQNDLPDRLPGKCLTSRACRKSNVTQNSALHAHTLRNSVLVLIMVVVPTMVRPKYFNAPTDYNNRTS